MDFKQLESFIGVVKHGSFSKAAKELFITQPTVSNNVQNLEKELGTVLLDRTSRTVLLTEGGKRFYPFAVELINTKDQALLAMADHKHQMEGYIDLCASSIPEQYILPYAIRDFQELHPGVSFRITHKNSREVVDEINRGERTFGIVGDRYRGEGLLYQPFYRDQLVLAVPADYDRPWAQKESVPLAEIFEEPFLMRQEGSGTRSFLESALAERDITLDNLKVVSWIDSQQMLKKMIELGLGISFVSRESVAEEVTHGKIRILEIENLPMERDFYFVYNKNRTLSPMVEAWRDFLVHWTALAPGPSAERPKGSEEKEST